MSRSYRKNSIAGMTLAGSEKEDKKIWHSRMRSKTRDLLNHLNEDEDEIFPVEDDASSTWDMTKDGKYYEPNIKNPKKMTDKEKARQSKQKLREAYQWYGK